MLDLSTNNHSLHWFLYDENARQTVGRQHRIPTNLIEDLTTMFNEINPYVFQLKSAITQINALEKTFSIQLDLPSQGGELAAIIHTANLTQLTYRKVVVFHHQQCQPRFISILSNQYEPLQYPLLFPYGESGWHMDMPVHSQCTYYRTRLLTEPRFRQMGRLTCEYLVDMYSRIEEE